MTVSELIEKLKSFDGEEEVLIYNQKYDDCEKIHSYNIVKHYSENTVSLN